MKASTEFVKNKLNIVIANFQKEIDCDHIWKEHGHGYKCSECGHYTGLNKELNEIIKRELLEEQLLKQKLSQEKTCKCQVKKTEIPGLIMLYAQLECTYHGEYHPLKG